MIEDSPEDADLVLDELRRGGFEVRWQRVDMPESLAAALAGPPWDLILSGYALLHLSGPRALEMVQERGIDVPFLVVSGSVGEEAAVAMMRAGAHDYFKKGNLTRLVASVERELRDAEVRRARRRAEEELRDSEARTRAILDAALDGIVSIDERGIIESFNPAAERLFGYRAGEVIGKSVRILMAPPDSESHENYVTNYLRTGERHVIGQSREVHARRKDGSMFLIDLSVSEVILGPRRIFTGTVRDITERKRAERRLATQYAVTRVLAESATLQEAMPNLLQAVCEASGWQLSELWLVDSDAGLLRWGGMWHAASIKPDELAAVSKQTTLRPGESLPGRVWESGQAAWVTDASSSSLVLRGAAAASAGLRGVSAFPISTGGTTVGVMVFFSRDTRQPDPELLHLLEAVGTQIGGFVARQRAEASRRESERRFGQFMEHLPGVAFIKDAAGRYVFVNQAFERLFGRATADYIGKTDEQVWPAETAAQLRANDEQVLRTGDVLQTVEIIPQSGGSHYWLATKFPIKGSAGTATVVAGIAIDITGRMRAEAEIRALRERALQRERLADIGAITAQIVHDVGNPLAGISMQAQLILHRARRDATQPLSIALQPAERILAEVSRLEVLIREFMEFSREQRLDLRSLPLPQFLREVAEIWHPVAAARRIKLTLDVAEDLPPVDADEDKLRRLFENLVKNAIEAIDQGPGRIHISASAPAPDRLRISVQDTGPGIADSVQVFRLFETTKPHGSGLGLAIVKQIVLAHGGEIGFQRVEPHGTVFHVELLRHRRILDELR